MAIFFAWGLPFMISLFGFAYFAIRKINRDLWLHKCITFGTVLFCLFGLAVSLLPLGNWAATCILCIIFYDKFEIEIKDFLSNPVCFWRKDE